MDNDNTTQNLYSMKKLVTTLILAICSISLNAQQWKYVGNVQAFENDNGSFWEVPDGAEIYSKIISGNTVYMAIIYDKEYIASKNTGLRTESYAYVAGNKYYFNINQTSTYDSNQEIITISADNTAIVKNGIPGDTWRHAPVETIINLKKKEVLIQDFVTREFQSYKIVNYATRDAGEVGLILDRAFLAIDTIGKTIRLMVDENTVIVQTDIKIE